MDEPSRKVSTDVGGDSDIGHGGTVDKEKASSSHELSSHLIPGLSLKEKEILAEILNDDTDSTYTAQEERKLLWKIDLHLLPLMAFTYGLQFLDKQALSYGAVIGLETDTHLHGSQYSLLTTIFYLGLLAGEYPVNVLLQKLPTAKITSVLVILWGTTLAAMTASTNFSQLATGRFFLGLFEAVIGPSMMLITSTWYRRSEQPLRTGIWYSFQGLAITLGGLLSYGVQKWGGSLTAWQNLFLFCGVITTAYGFVLLLFLPDNIVASRWLSDREKKIAFLRLREEKIGIGNRQWKWYQVREAASDPKIYLIVLFSFAANWTTSVNAFGALLIKGFGFSSLHTTLLNMPAGAFNVGTILVLSYLSSKIKNVRCLSMAICYIFATIGSAMLLSLPRSKRYSLLAGVWFTAMGPAGFTISLSVATSNVTGQTKRVITNASVFVAFAVGNMVSPQLYLDRQAPKYRTGIIGILVANVCAIILAGLLAAYMHYQNVLRDREAKNNVDAAASHNRDEGLKDMTDIENRSFRYMF